MTPFGALAPAAGLLLAALVYDPQILTLEFADGGREEVAASSPDACAAAVRAIERQDWIAADGWDGASPLGRRAVTAHCRSGLRFAPCSEFIAGYNAPPACGGSGGSR